MVNNGMPKFGKAPKAGSASLDDEIRRAAHIPSQPGPWIRAAQLPGLFCSWDLAYRCTRSGWLKPIVQGKRRTIYRLADVLNCMRRIEAGELPSARPKRNIA
jgi:hypothetical protein